MANKVGSRGQIVLDKRIRDRLGIEAGYRVIQLVVDDHVELDFIPPDHNQSLMGVLAPYVTEPIPESDDDWHAVKALAWKEAAKDKMGMVEED